MRSRESQDQVDVVSAAAVVVVVFFGRQKDNAKQKQKRYNIFGPELCGAVQRNRECSRVESNDQKWSCHSSYAGCAQTKSEIKLKIANENSEVTSINCCLDPLKVQSEK